MKLNKPVLQVIPLAIALAISTGCETNTKEKTDSKDASAAASASNSENQDFVYQVDQFADLRILRYRVPGFNELAPKQKEMLYYLYQAALSGRDIYYDQNCKYNLAVRKTLENIISTYKGAKNCEDYQRFLTYAKRFWFSNGIHHHYSNDKLFPECSRDYFKGLIKNSDVKGFPVLPAYADPSLHMESTNAPPFEVQILKIIYDPAVAAKRVNLDPKMDLVTTSADNFYEGVTQKEVSAFYDGMADKNDKQPVMFGLNSKVVKENGMLVEKKWMIGGMYTAAIEKMVAWLEKASAVAENSVQKDALDKMIKFYKSGDLKDFDDYNISWVKDAESIIDVVNGFIEVYHDPLGKKGSFEAIVSIKDMEASKRIKAIGDQAQWFEDHSPIMDAHKKKSVTGIKAKVINVVLECGDAAPSTPIGINLPNNEWIRAEHGSKSVNLGNIVDAYGKAGSKGVVDEFYYNDEVKDRVKKYADLADKLHTDMHEVIGHASGQINPGVGQPAETLKSYASALEEARADLVALYYLMDQKLVDIGVMPNLDYGKAAYDEYLTKGLMVQLARIKAGNNLEEAHMRNRQMIAKWVLKKGEKENVVEKKTKEGKTYFVINDYAKMRTLFGALLMEIQRIKSEGDYKAGHDLIENYGVLVDQDLHKEVLDRYHRLNIAPYMGFIQPRLVPVMAGDKITDVKIEYPMDFVEQMMEYGKNYAFLPVEN